MLQFKKILCIKCLVNALVAESVDAADLKSVVRKDVPVQVWPSAPMKWLAGCSQAVLVFKCKRKPPELDQRFFTLENKRYQHFDNHTDSIVK